MKVRVTHQTSPKKTKARKNKGKAFFEKQRQDFISTNKRWWLAFKKQRQKNKGRKNKGRKKKQRQLAFVSVTFTDKNKGEKKQRQDLESNFEHNKKNKGKI